MDKGNGGNEITIPFQFTEVRNYHPLTYNDLRESLFRIV